MRVQAILLLILLLFVMYFSSCGIIREIKQQIRANPNTQNIKITTGDLEFIDNDSDNDLEYRMPEVAKYLEELGFVIVYDAFNQQVDL